MERVIQTTNAPPPQSSARGTLPSAAQDSTPAMTATSSDRTVAKATSKSRVESPERKADILL